MDLTISEAQASSAETRRWPFAVTSGILGWILDAFDFFVVIFLLDTLAAISRLENLQLSIRLFLRYPCAL